ncbi:MAG: Polysaccharide deacetylase [Armatimonadetes bacterium]|jgi:peptidoglycan/xylan/chitin deacetylase (PgdA/CDA1 family)|nr:Polysaccharide deacetylase [Armatimonadota bacterium]
MLAARVASRLGLLRGLRQARANRGLLVLAYHRVGDPAGCPLNEELFSVTAAGLAEHVRLLQRWARVTDLEEVLAGSASGRSPREPLVLLTFDDVYRDNHSVAFPILRDAGVPGVFFVPTGLIESRHVPWWDRIAYAVKRSRVESCRLDYPAECELTGLRTDPKAAMVQVLRLYKRDAGLDKERLIQALEAATGASALDAPELGELFATWSELREMAEGGMTLASHTHSHRLLGHLPYSEQLEELATSRDVLRARTGVATCAVAYPVGRRTHFNQDTRAALKQLGYQAGFSHYGGWNRAVTDPYDIRRVRMDLSVDPELLHAAVSLPRLFAT